MTTLLLHASQYKRCKAEAYKQQQLSGDKGRRRFPAAAASRLLNQPDQAAFTHCFAPSKVARSRYTSAPAADLPSPAMSAADTQTAPYCMQQLGSVIRSYSDPDLPGHGRRHAGGTTSAATAAASSLSAAAAASAVAAPEGSAASAAPVGAVATFSISSIGERLVCPVSFRHSFDCLLNIDSDDTKVSPTTPPSQPPPMLPRESPTQLRKVASCNSPVRERPRKRVQFADEVGRPLMQVRVFSEPSCVPPMLSIKLHRDFPAGDADDETTSGQTAGGNGGGKFKCQFAQPSSKYILFRENVEKNCVSLSNLYFDEDTAKGSVAVKNISFNKRVFLRVTFDEWTSFRDVQATFASSQDSRQDMFAFSFQCPIGCERGFQFCVCYEAGSQVFWDSNGSTNYKVSARKPKTKKSADAYTSDYKPNFSGVTEFTEFSVWDHFSDRVYY